MGLRDAYELAGEIINTRNTPNTIGTPAMLSKYRQRRRIDSSAGRIFTDSLVKLFTNENKIIKNSCGFGLNTLACIPPAKRFVARRMIFGARG